MDTLITSSLHLTTVAGLPLRTIRLSGWPKRPAFDIMPLAAYEFTQNKTNVQGPGNSFKLPSLR